MEEEELTVDISTSYLDHVMESVTQMMKSEIKFDVSKEELLQTSKGVLPKVLMVEESKHDIKLGNHVPQSEKGDNRQPTSDVMPSDVSHSLQLEHAETHMVITDDHPSTNAIKGKGCAGANIKPDHFLQKATQSQFPLLSVSPPSNISGAVTLLRKRKSNLIPLHLIVMIHVMRPFNKKHRRLAALQYPFLRKHLRHHKTSNQQNMLAKYH